jgi:hypothetical protein
VPAAAFLKEGTWFSQTDGRSASRGLQRPDPVFLATAPVADRIGPALKYLIINAFTVSAVFFLTFVLFVRYDVR